ncbi:MAG: cupin domain-containing protein [Chloroflexota bacterium]
MIDHLQPLSKRICRPGTPGFRTIVRGVLALTISMVLAAGGLMVHRQAEAQTPPAIQSTLVATQGLSGVPAGRRWVARYEHQLNSEHQHAGGFMYVPRGSVRLLMEGEDTAFTEGQGIWIPESTPHTHKIDTDGQVWTFTLETAAELAAAPVTFNSDEIKTVNPIPHLARLSADTFPPGASTPPHRHYGPEFVLIREGQYELTSRGSARPYASGQGYTMEPTVPHLLRNASDGSSRLFNVSLVPLSRQGGEAVAREALGQ